MKITEKMIQLKFLRDYMLVKKYGHNIHDLDLTETIQTGVVDKLMMARELGIDYAVVLENVVPLGKNWDKYGDGTWQPKRAYIATDDIQTPDNDRMQEEKNIYDFLRGKTIEKSKLDSADTLTQQNISKKK